MQTDFAMAANVGTNQRIVDRMLAEGKLQRAEHATIVNFVTRHKTRVEEALIDLEIMTELDVLKYVAMVYETRFVSSEKLSKAAIDARVLAKVPAKIAAMHGVFPVLFDERSGALSVVTADPDNDVAMHELRLTAGVKSVQPLVARPAAVRAAIAFHYHGDKNAFSQILRTGITDILGRADPFQRKRPSSIPPRLTPVEEAAAARATMPDQSQARKSTAPARRASSPPGPAPGRPTGAPPAAVEPAAPPPRNRTTPTPPGEPEFLEALNVLVSLLENARPDLRGHSAMVARLVRRTCERIGLSPHSTEAIAAAGYLHDLGKMGAYHLTSLNVAEYEGHRVAAHKAIELPSQLMESVHLWPETIAAMGAMYERWDGRGIPNGQQGKEIPLGARVLSIVDTYADLTQNPKNPYRKVLRPFEACDVLVQYKGTVFDPNVVEIFRQAMTGDDMRAKLLHDRHQALVVDPDPEETTVLELRLLEQGFEVKIARTVAQAKMVLEAGDIAVVVSEVDLDEVDAGLALRDSALRDGYGRDVSWVILTGKADRQTAQRAFDLGVDDFVAKPAATDIVAAKLRQLIERKRARSGDRGVAGSLAEMSLPDMVQILWHGRKTCALRIRSQTKSGEIEFTDGQVVNARWESVRGEEAFYQMLSLREGDFRLDPSFKPKGRAINASPEALLLEGMRRIDEGSRAPSP